MPAPHRLSSLHAAEPGRAVAELQHRLHATYGSVRATALDIGVHEGTLHRWIQQWGLRDWLQEAYPAGDRIAAGADKRTVDIGAEPRGYGTSVAGANYVLHIRAGDRTLCGRIATMVNCAPGPDTAEALCRVCLRKRHAT